MRFPDLSFRKRQADAAPEFPAPTPGATHTEDGWRDISPSPPARPSAHDPLEEALAQPEANTPAPPHAAARNLRIIGPLLRDPLANPLLGLGVGIALFFALRAIYVDGALPFLYRGFQ